mmetsp:Transcript_17518/g.27750  ORF Transcript_17518/g.27750 Transcript_17518/m.27750 type:complete len:254 (-) Transcript_17518:270-1031(-)
MHYLLPVRWSELCFFLVLLYAGASWNDFQSAAEAFCASRGTSSNKNNFFPSASRRPIIPSDSFAHLSALKDRIQILPTLDGKGMGAFTTVPIVEGAVLGEYFGESLTRREVEARYWGIRKESKHDRKWRTSRKRRNQGMSGDYLFDMGSDVFIDGEDADVSSWCRFANHASLNDEPGACNVEARSLTHDCGGVDGQGFEEKSVVVDKKDGLKDEVVVGENRQARLFFFALRDIDIGEEICYDYGLEYWEDGFF